MKRALKLMAIGAFTSLALTSCSESDEDRAKREFDEHMDKMRDMRPEEVQEAVREIDSSNVHEEAKRLMKEIEESY